MIAAGIDLGGTKIEAQVFDTAWHMHARQRWPTPKTYPDLIAAMQAAAQWCAQAAARADLPIGVAAAGLINPATGLALTANLAASGRAFPTDVQRAAGRAITWVNDARALALSEARFGAAMGHNPALALIFGTGLGGGLVIDGKIPPSFAGIGGEFGHFPLPAGPIVAHGLPVLACSCGRIGCAETLLSAPGLCRIAAHVTARNLTPEQIIAARNTDAGLQQAWDIWAQLAGEFLMTLCFTIDPAVIVVGGGLSAAPRFVDDLSQQLQRATFAGFPTAPLKLAQGGPNSGARGAAFAAWQQVQG